MFRILFEPLIKIIQRVTRKHMRPMSVDEAERKKEFFAKIYMICAVSIFSLVGYQAFASRVDTTIGGGINTKKILEGRGITGDVRVLTFDGFTKVKDYTVNLDSDGNVTVKNDSKEEE